MTTRKHKVQWHPYVRTYVITVNFFHVILKGSTPLQINTNFCHPPDPIRQLRKVDLHFLKGLKKRMIQDPAAPGVSPVALLCHKRFVTVSSDFRVSLRNQCQYEVLGGLHTVIAKKELMAEIPGKQVFGILRL